MATLHLSIKEVTILSTMILLAHTLPVELSIQKKAGGSFLGIMFIRLFSSILMGLILNLIIPVDSSVANINLSISSINDSPSFISVLTSWLLENVIVIKIIVINILITIFYKILKRYGIVEKISNLFKYIMFIFGLPKETAFLWIVTNVIGLIYGASMLIEAKEKGSLDDISLKKLNISISTCHSLIQETANFMVVGASWVYLIVPRVIVSIVFVWIYNAYLVFESSRIKVTSKSMK